MATKIDSRQIIKRDILNNLGIDAANKQLDIVLNEIDSHLGQLRIQPADPISDRAIITGANVSKLNGLSLGQTIKKLMMDFSGAQIDFTTGTIYEDDGVSALGINFTPTVIPANEYHWYSVTLVPSSVNSDNTIGVQIVVVPGTNTHADPALANKAAFATGTPLGQIRVQQNAGNTALEDITWSDITQLGTSGGSGSGEGDAVQFVNEMDIRLYDSFFESYTPIVFPSDEDTFEDVASTGAYSIADGFYEIDTAQHFTSINLYDSVFIAEARKVLIHEVVVDWFDDAGRDDGATYELSIDGGVSYEAITMTRQEGTNRYLGRVLLSDNATFNDLRIKITASEAESKIENIAVFYNEVINGTVGGKLQQQTFIVNGNDDQVDFVMTQFLPDVTLTKLRVAETGQAFVSPAFTINGYTVSVPSGTFDAPGETFTVVIEQTEGNTFDNSDQNANNIANLDTRVSDVESQIFVSSKNRIINPFFRLSQRGDFTTASAGVSATYSVDRFKTLSTGVTFDKQHISSNQPTELGYSRSFRMTATSTATGNIDTQQWIENPQEYMGQTMTLSCYVKSNNANARISLYNNAHNVGSTAHTGDGTWQRLSVTANIDSAVNLISLVRLMDASAVDVSVTVFDYIETTGWQLEFGDKVTDVEMRPLAEELQLCQRYYVAASSQNSGTARNSGMCSTNINFPVEMRTTPTIIIEYGGIAGRIRSYQDGSLHDNCSPTVGLYSTRGIAGVNCANNTLIPGDPHRYHFGYQADAEL